MSERNVCFAEENDVCFAEENDDDDTSFHFEENSVIPARTPRVSCLTVVFDNFRRVHAGGKAWSGHYDAHAYATMKALCMSAFVPWG